MLVKDIVIGKQGFEMFGNHFPPVKEECRIEEVLALHFRVAGGTADDHTDVVTVCGNPVDAGQAAIDEIIELQKITRGIA